jgi:hypothetical protein
MVNFGASQLNSSVLRTSRGVSSSDMENRILGRWMLISGWVLCVGVALLVFDLLRTLPELPATWWFPEEPISRGGELLHWDLRSMVIDPGFPGWLGEWAYLASLGWALVAVFRVVQGLRRGVLLRTAERVLLACLTGLLVGISGLTHFTPLRYVAGPLLL